MKYDISGKYGDVEIFAVEGATAAMCYIFDSLMANELLKKRRYNSLNDSNIYTLS
uniref:Aspartate aminotransferase n=1 Tax=Clostridioides difficile TaxID=1496 RepID=A0A381IEJ2_CLODI|nr:aspartate aminotransferase [Clostridioides difficile]